MRCRYSPPRVDVIGVACYSSTDLLHWHNEGLPLSKSTSRRNNICKGTNAFPQLANTHAGLALKGESHPDLRKSNVVERPKVLFHRCSMLDCTSAPCPA